MTDNHNKNLGISIAIFAIMVMPILSGCELFREVRDKVWFEKEEYMEGPRRKPFENSGSVAQMQSNEYRPPLQPVIPGNPNVMPEPYMSNVGSAAMPSSPDMNSMPNMPQAAAPSPYSNNFQSSYPSLQNSVNQGSMPPGMVQSPYDPGYGSGVSPMGSQGGMPPSPYDSMPMPGSYPPAMDQSPYGSPSPYGQMPPEAQAQMGGYPSGYNNFEKKESNGFFSFLNFLNPFNYKEEAKFEPMAEVIYLDKPYEVAFLDDYPSLHDVPEVPVAFKEKEELKKKMEKLMQEGKKNGGNTDAGRELQLAPSLSTHK